MNLSLKHCRIISSFVCPDSFPKEASRTTGKLALGPSEHLKLRNSQLDARRPTSILARVLSNIGGLFGVRKPVGTPRSLGTPLHGVALLSRRRWFFAQDSEV